MGLWYFSVHGIILGTDEAWFWGRLIKALELPLNRQTFFLG